MRVNKLSGCYHIWIMSVTFAPHTDKLITIQPGIQVHSFAYLIPMNCPTSFEGRYGHIRYSINVIILCAEQREHRFLRIFTINNVMDLNYNSPLLKVNESIAFSLRLGMHYLLLWIADPSHRTSQQLLWLWAVYRAILEHECPSAAARVCARTSDKRRDNRPQWLKCADRATGVRPFTYGPLLEPKAAALRQNRLHGREPATGRFGTASLFAKILLSVADTSHAANLNKAFASDTPWVSAGDYRAHTRPLR